MSTCRIAVTHPPDALLLWQDMTATPSELLREALKKTKTTPTALGKKLGYSTPYQTVSRWVKGRGFNTENQRKVAEAMGFPSNYFEQPDLAAARERYRVMMFAEFLQTEIGQKLTPEHRKILESTRFQGKTQPNVNLYSAWALALQGKIADEQVEEVAAENDALDRELEESRERNASRKPPQPPRQPSRHRK